MRRILLVLLLLLEVQRGWSADLNVYAKNYIARVSNSDKPAFFASCRNNGSVAILIATGSEASLLVELEDNAVVNLGNIKFLKGSPRVVETGGGVDSYDRVQDIATKLARGRFDLLTPERSVTLLAQKPSNECGLVRSAYGSE